MFASLSIKSMVLIHKSDISMIIIIVFFTISISFCAAAAMFIVVVADYNYKHAGAGTETRESKARRSIQFFKVVFQWARDYFSIVVFERYLGLN